ncbi:MAG TPA: type IV-A pilus assembly ATPase PilB, partial [Burkholderiaceae bacterium]|nr:type IV-A pilus assembly ATPase PilB [Burkholderiaceae bacterium]
MAIESLEVPQTHLSGVARILARAGHIESRNADELTRQAREKKSSFVAQVIESGTMKALPLAHALSTALSVPLLDLDAIDPRLLPQDIVGPKLIAQYRVLPLGRRGGRLFLACADPTDQEAVERIKFATQLTPEWVVCEYDKLMRLVNDQQASAKETLDALATSDFEFEVTDDEPTKEPGGPESSAEVEDAPVVKFLHKMLVDAINMRASDLHFEPYE